MLSEQMMHELHTILLLVQCGHSLSSKRQSESAESTNPFSGGACEVCGEQRRSHVRERVGSHRGAGGQAQSTRIRKQVESSVKIAMVSRVVQDKQK